MCELPIIMLWADLIVQNQTWITIIIKLTTEDKINHVVQIPTDFLSKSNHRQTNCPIYFVQRDPHIGDQTPIQFILSFFELISTTCEISSGIRVKTFAISGFKNELLILGQRVLFDFFFFLLILYNL